MNTRLSLLLACSLFLGDAHAADVKVLLLSPSNTFPGANIATQLQALLQGSGDYGTATVQYGDVFQRDNFGDGATSLLSYYFHADFRASNLDLIRTGGWTHVVMIDRPFFYGRAVEFHFEAVDELARVISSAGAQPVLMMPWYDASTIVTGQWSHPTSNALIREFAYRVGDGARDLLGQAVPVVPAGVAWSTLAAALRGAPPASAGGAVALNVNGEYCAAAALFTHLSGRNARSVAFLPAGLDSATRDGIADHTMATPASEAVALRYTGAFESPVVKLWPDPGATIRFCDRGTSTEWGVAQSFGNITTAAGKTPERQSINLYNTPDQRLPASPVDLFFGRIGYAEATSVYDTATPPTTMVSAFDRVNTSVSGISASEGPTGARRLEDASIMVYGTAWEGASTMAPYHLLWAKTLYDLNIPIEMSGVHASDWHFNAYASALFAQRTGGLNGIYPAKLANRVYNPHERTQRFAWQTGHLGWQTIYRMARLTQAPPLPVRPFGLDRIIDAEGFSATTGTVGVERNATETFQLTGMNDGATASYPIDFGATAQKAIVFSARVAATVAGGAIEVRDGAATGTLLCTLNVPATGGATAFSQRRAEFARVALPGLTGQRTVVFVFRVPAGVAFKLDHFTLVLPLRKTTEDLWIAGGNGSWSAAANWNDSVPNGRDRIARFTFELPSGLPPASTVTLDGDQTVSRIEIGTPTQYGSPAPNTGRITIAPGTGGTLYFDVTDPQNCVVNKDGGGNDTLDVPIVCRDPLHVRTTKSGTTITLTKSVTGGKSFYYGGAIRLTGPSVTLARLGYDNTNFHPTGSLDWAGPAGTMTSLYIKTGSSFTLNGGTAENTGTSEIGGDLKTDSPAGTATFTINGGTFRHRSTTAPLRLAERAAVNAVVVLNGGVIETAQPFVRTNGTASITLNGGTLRYTAEADTAALLGSGVPVTIGTGGAVVEITSAARTAAIAGSLTGVAGDGGLRKGGAGTLALATANSFSGPVRVDAGRLRLLAPGALGTARAFTVSAGATLDLTALVVRTLTLNQPSATLSGTGTISGDLAVSSGTVTLTAGQPLAVTGAVALGGNLMATGTLTTPGDYVLLTGAAISGAFDGAVTLPAPPVGYTRQLIYEASRVLIRVSGAADTWLATNAPGQALADDPDQDGNTLLEEFALGGSASESDGPLTVEGRDGTGRLTLHFDYNLVALDTGIEVLASDDLVVWTPILTKARGTATTWTGAAAFVRGAASAGFEPIAVTDTAVGATRRFLRVRLMRD